MNKEWLDKTVNTKGRYCPHMRGKCPGSKDKCSFWIIESIQNGASQDIQEGCLFCFNYVVANATQMEQQRTIATMDKLSSQVEGFSGQLRNVAIAMVGRLRIPRDNEPLEIPSREE